ncbi:hypothetical protein ACIHCQ_02245 [Streptomyces sp. NPDC052236]|uniref:hypothetical protein n=1 Tax=Streptomyces sp. NPDC052236 TaxID=3365686 RepID=UPI0037D3D0E0
MAAHAAVPTRHHHGSLAWALPIALGVIYGFYVAFIERDGGSVTGGNVVLGVVSGAVFAALAFALGRVQYTLPREVRALAYGAVFAMAVGFLVSLGGSSVLRAAGLGVAAGVLPGVVSFYIFYTRE